MVATKGPIFYNDSNDVTIGGGATASKLKILEPSGSGTNFSAFTTQAQAADITYTLPATVGSAGNVLAAADGSGGLTWSSAGSGTVTASGPPVANQLAYWTTATNITGNAELTLDSQATYSALVINSAKTYSHAEVYNTSTTGASQFFADMNDGTGYQATIMMTLGSAFSGPDNTNFGNATISKNDRLGVQFRQKNSGTGPILIYSHTANATDTYAPIQFGMDVLTLGGALSVSVNPFTIASTGVHVLNGTAALPGLTFDPNGTNAGGDPDTGFWHPSANTLSISTGGVERLRVDSSGNLTTGDTAKIQVGDPTNGMGEAIDTGLSVLPVSGNWAQAMFMADNATSAVTVIGTKADALAGGRFQFLKTRGTRASPTNTLSGDVYGAIEFGGYHASALFFASLVEGVATENNTSTSALGSKLVFRTTANGSAGSGGLKANTAELSSENTAALPVLTFMNDPNTGIWHPAADTLAISNNGIEHVNIGPTGGTTVTHDNNVQGDDFHRWNVDGYGALNILNQNTGASANAQFLVGQGTTTGTYGGNIWAGSGNPNSNLYTIPSSILAYSMGAGGYTVGAFDTGGVIRFATGGVALANERVRIASAVGTAALPTISLDADTNTGIFHPGADTLALSTAGTERWRTDSGGTTTFRVDNSGSSSTIVVIGNYGAAANGTKARLSFGANRSTGTQEFGYIYVNVDDNIVNGAPGVGEQGRLVLGSMDNQGSQGLGATDTLQISRGNVGIAAQLSSGTVRPNAILDVFGNTLVSTTTSNINAKGTSGTGTITVGTTTGIPEYGTILIDDEAMTYWSYDGTTVSIVARAQWGTTGATHTNGATVTFAEVVASKGNTTTPHFVVTSNGSVGVSSAAPKTTLDITGDFATRSTSPGAFTGSQNDFAIGAYSFARISGSSTPIITGILANNQDGHRLVVSNVGATAIQINDQDTGSTAANRIITGTATNFTLAVDATTEFIYDATTTRWRKIG